MVDSRCSDIYGATLSWGNTICISPPGGQFNSTPGNDTSGGDRGPGGSGDGCSLSIVTLPTGTKLASNTAKNCGEFYTVKAGDTCRGIIVLSNTPSDLFIDVNPSLGSAEFCNSQLKTGLTYCLHPVRGWEQDVGTVPTRGPPPGTTSISSTASVRPTTSIITSIKPTSSITISIKPTSSIQPTTIRSSTPITSIKSSTSIQASTTIRSSSTVPKPSTPAPPNGQCGSSSPINATCQGSTFGSCCSTSVRRPSASSIF
jgi:hypothetical protein